MSINEDHPIRIQRSFDVPVDRLFRAWSDPMDLAGWIWGRLGSSVEAEVDFRVGGSIRVTTTRPGGERWSFSGRYTDIQANLLIEHTLFWEAPMGYGPVPEQIWVMFLQRGTGSEIDFAHAGVPDEKSAEGHLRGWRDAFDTLDVVLRNSRSSHDPSPQA
jgi:uncharacterized protein YndB with AHSA1/START domain